MKIKPPENLWDDYRQIVPSDASRTQIIETKRAFTSGMFVALQFMRAVTALHLTDEEATNRIFEFDQDVQIMLMRILQQDTIQETH
jgi:hypothetical protein